MNSALTSRKQSLLLVLWIFLGLIAARDYDTPFNLKDIRSQDGILFLGYKSSQNIGKVVSRAGDFNNDGYDDIIIGSSKHTFLIYGLSNSSNRNFYLEDLDGTKGFAIAGISSSTIKISDAGDVNGDGYDDIIIGYRYAWYGTRYYCGVSYLIYGAPQGEFGSNLNLTNIHDNVVQVIGPASYYQTGLAVSSAGDFNNDGYDDFVIASYTTVFLVYGSATFGGVNDTFDLANVNGTNGMELYRGDSVVVTTTNIGDINGDGYDDVLVGSNDYYGDNKCYVVFGGVYEVSSLNMTAFDGTYGFVIHPKERYQYTGSSLDGIGDFNGDGYADFVIGAYYADPGSKLQSGQSYVIFGGGDVGESGILLLDDLNGKNGFTIKGRDAYDWSGYSVSGAGDVNGDGYDDVLIGAVNGDRSQAQFPTKNLGEGESYVIFGGEKVGQDGSIKLGKVDFKTYLTLYGSQDYESSATSISGVGDFNGDGFADLLIGAPNADIQGNYDAGRAYLLFDTYKEAWSWNIQTIITCFFSIILVVLVNLYICVDQFKVVQKSRALKRKKKARQQQRNEPSTPASSSSSCFKDIISVMPIKEL